jgi:predicted RNase H-like HicB family nuclease
MRDLRIVAKKFTFLLELAEEGGFIVKGIELQVATESETKAQALAKIKEAIEGYLEVKAKVPDKKPKRKDESSCRNALCVHGLKLNKSSNNS